MLPAGVDPARGMFGTGSSNDAVIEPMPKSKKVRLGDERLPMQGEFLLPLA